VKFLSFLILAVLALIAGFGANLLAAQFACFGLAQYHIQSGLMGPFFLGLALEGFVALGAASSRSGK
jgi:hypothetical protein